MADIKWDRPLAGGAKNLLDDIRALNEKIPTEMERGVREGYLETDRIAGLAERLGVRPPRIKTRRYVYVETRQIQSYAVDAYDDADAMAQAESAIGTSLRRGEALYGMRRSHWAGNENRSLVCSEMTTTRPAMNHNLRFYLNRRDEPVALHPGTATSEAVEAATQSAQSEGLPMPDPVAVAETAYAAAIDRSRSRWLDAAVRTNMDPQEQPGDVRDRLLLAAQEWQTRSSDDVNVTH